MFEHPGAGFGDLELGRNLGVGVAGRPQPHNLGGRRAFFVEQRLDPFKCLPRGSVLGQGIFPRETEQIVIRQGLFAATQILAPDIARQTEKPGFDLPAFVAGRCLQRPQEGIAEQVFARWGSRQR